MFIPFGNPLRSTCDGISRRHALRIGTSGLIAGLSLPRLLELQATAATEKATKAKACIFIFLEGGPSQLDMWDLKPEAPAEIRGLYKPIRTSVTGTQICEHLPLCAKVAHKYTIVRSHSHNDNGHNTGYHYVMTGYKADFPDGNSRVPNNHLYPSVGSIISRELGPRTTLPPYINMPHMMSAGGPGFYGSEHAPFVIESNPVQADFEVQDLHPLEKPQLLPPGPARPAAGRGRKVGEGDGAGPGEVDVHLLSAGQGPDGLARRPQGLRPQGSSRNRSARATATPPWGSAPCWPAGWWRRAAALSASTTAAGTITSRSSRVSKRTCCPTSIGPTAPCSTTWSSAACWKARWW